MLDLIPNFKFKETDLQCLVNRMPLIQSWRVAAQLVTPCYLPTHPAVG
jgi:hypothetical protein